MHPLIWGNNAAGPSGLARGGHAGLRPPGKRTDGFWILLALAAIIATAGVLANSDPRPARAHHRANRPRAGLAATGGHRRAGLGRPKRGWAAGRELRRGRPGSRHR